MGRYSVLGFLAAGGMAELLLARLDGPGGFSRPVAIKRILPHLARQPEFVDMFVDEARIVARLRHPNVVQVHELVHDGGELYQIMEYLEGESGVGVMRRLRARGLPLPWELAAFIVAEACSGLAAAHSAIGDDGAPLQLVHRDISPENLFVTYDGSVKLLDFGIAKARDRLTHTRTGLTKGKFAYMSPEQCAGRAIDARSDLFAVGIVLYELLVGKRLFRRDNDAATVRAVCELKVPPPSSLRADVPSALDAICLRALERDPGNRYPTAIELRCELLACLRASSETAPGQALGALMQACFGDRIADKRALLARAEAGDPVGELPTPEVDGDVALPEVETTAEPARLRRRRSRVAGVAALALVVVGGVAGGAWVARRGHTSRALAAPARSEAPPNAPHAAASATTPAAPAAAPTTTAPSSDVRIEIGSTPLGAHVFVDGHDRGVTPLVLRQPRGSAPLHLTLRKSGFVALERAVRPEVDQVLQLLLARAPRRSPSPASAGFHRFD